MKKNQKSYGVYVWRVLFVGILLAITGIRVSRIEIPVSSSSELPYWDLILRMAGHTGVINVSKVNYIASVGYCLPFALLIRGGMSLLNVYKVSILTNGLFWAFMYGVTIQLLKKAGMWISNTRKKEVLLSVLFLLPIFVSEALLMGPQILLGIFTLLLLLRCASEKKEQTGKEGIWYCLLGWLGTFLSPVFLGVLLGIFVYVWMDKRERKNSLKWLVAFLAGLLFMEVAEQMLLLCLQTSYNQWSYTGIHSLFVMVAQGRRTTGILGLFYGLVGKGMYLAVNTFGLVILGLFALWKEKGKISSIEKASLLVFANTLFLCIAMERSDSLCGFPVDTMLVMVVFPILWKAIAALLEGKSDIKEVMLVSASILILGCLSRDIWERNKDLVFDWSSSGVLALGRNFCRDVFEISILAAAVAAIIFVVIWITNIYGTAIKEEAKGKFLKLYTGFFQMIMWGILILIVGMAVRYYMVDVLSYAKEKITFSYEIPGDYLKKTEQKIYCYLEDETDSTDAFVRLLSMEDREISYAESLNGVEQWKEDSILMTNAMEEVPEQISDYYDRVYSTDQVILWERKSTQAKKTLQDALLGEKVELVRVNSSNFQYEEYGKNHVQVKGAYKAEVEFKIATSKKGKLGKVWIKTGGKTLAAKAIVGNGKLEKQKITISFQSLEDMKNFKVAVEKKSSVYMDVERVSIEKVGDADEKEE